MPLTSRGIQQPIPVLKSVCNAIIMTTKTCKIKISKTLPSMTKARRVETLIQKKGLICLSNAAYLSKI